ALAGDEVVGAAVGAEGEAALAFGLGVAAGTAFGCGGSGGGKRTCQTKRTATESSAARSSRRLSKVTSAFRKDSGEIDAADRERLAPAEPPGRLGAALRQSMLKQRQTRVLR